MINYDIFWTLNYSVTLGISTETTPRVLRHGKFAGTIIRVGLPNIDLDRKVWVNQSRGLSTGSGDAVGGRQGVRSSIA